MRILANKQIKALFFSILGTLVLGCSVIQAIILAKYNQFSIPVWLVFLAMTILLCIAFFLYFKHQDKVMEGAIKQVERIIAGESDVRIPCDEEGELYRLFYLVNNLSAVLSAHAEKEGKEKQFLKNTISDISHQLKTPLAALTIYNDLMLGSGELPEVHELAGHSEKEIERINILVQNLLKITKLDAGTIVWDKHPESVPEMMKDIELHHMHRAKQENKELKLIGEENVELFCDRDWLMEAIDNLVKNALDHTVEGNCIELSWKQLSASMIQIRVKDNGSGIHEEDLHHIFKRFYRSRYSQDKQGLGLGLPLAKNIIEGNGGTIEVDSIYGQGTTFTINFWIPTEL